MQMVSDYQRGGPGPVEAAMQRASDYQRQGVSTGMDLSDMFAQFAGPV